jgi:hypothetical protein
MEAKEILEKVKLYFTELMAPAPAPAPALEVKEYELKDGGKVMIDKLEEGGIVVIDGNPALPGDMELVDGTKITVADNGVITAVTPGEPAEIEQPDPSLEMATKFTAFETSANEKFANYETKFAAYDQRFADYEVKMKKANKVIEELMNLSQLIVDAPAADADPVVRKTNQFKEEKEKNYSILFN